MKKILSVMCYNVLVVIVIFVGIELSSYILLAHHHLAEKLGLYEVMKVVHIGHMNVIQNTDCARYDKGLFYTLNPGVCKFDSDAFKSTFSVEVKVNSQGTRDEEDRLKAPEIICIGDSHIMGWGVKQEESCPKLIERYTGKKTLNAGVSSYGTARELMLLSKLDRKNLKYLILEYCENDINENIEYIKHNGNLPISPEAERYTAMRINVDRVKYYPGKLVLQLAKTIGSTTIKNNLPAITDNDSEQEIKQHVDYMLKCLELCGIDFSGVQIIVYPMMLTANDVETFVKYAQLRSSQSSLVWEKNIHYVDQSSLYSKEFILPYDAHFNALGQQKLSEMISPLIPHNTN